MKKSFTNNKRLRKHLIICLGIILFISGCYKIAYIIQPTQVNPESAFNVTVCIEPSPDAGRDDFSPSYGVLGIMLPKGWTVLDSIKYTLNLQEPYSSSSGFLFYNDSVASFLDSVYDTGSSEYYWWGAKSEYKMSLITLEEGFVYITIITDSVIGEFNLKYALGDDGPYSSITPKAPYVFTDRTGLMPISVDYGSAVKSWSQVKWNVYPNPSNGEVFVTQDDLSGDVTLKVYDLNGKLQKSTVLSESLSRVDLSTLSKGTYIISLEKKGEIKTKKIIIQ
ncbi:T9SS type A sorting domain-containing protein [Maribellus sediminis]|uniref:T9SS type A sorting domain-containing protein n=1 Tax=Maribellus sediminis TaxID=2696285 RepID=UPI00142F4E02|nr:T9SS type A sorting domain-containing protein [Maribellus sediminis]